MEIAPGRVYPNSLSSEEEIENLKFDELYSEGYIFISLNGGVAKAFEGKYTKLPINIILTSDTKQYITPIKTENRPDFVIKQGDVVKYVCINGYLCNITEHIGGIRNGAIVR